VFDGNPATVDKTLAAALRETVATFEKDATISGVTPSPSYADKLKSLQELADAQWKEAVRDKETKAYEAANKAILAAKSRSVFDGNPATVDKTLAAALRETIATFEKDATIPGVTPSPSYADKLKSLQELADAQWKEAHQLNKAAHQSKRSQLRSTIVPAVDMRIDERIDSCGNNHHEREYNLGERFPAYFANKKRHLLHNVKTNIDAIGGREGTLNLDPNAGEHQVSTGGVRYSKWKVHELYYNAANTVLRVVLDGGGWGSGNCNNRLWMKSVTLTVTCNALALPENTVYDKDYPQTPAIPKI
jgi:hypothetical protein